MKLILSSVASVFLMLGLAACSQRNVTNSDKKVSTIAIQTTKTEKVETTKESNTNQTNAAQNESINNQNQVPVTLVETVDEDTIKVNYNGK